MSNRERENALLEPEVRNIKISTRNSMAERKGEGKYVNEQETEAIIHTGKSPQHHKETHGRSDDIDENTQVDEVKGPNVFERVKEEVEALAETILPKKESKNHDPS